MIPVIEAFQKTYGLETITIVADAGMFSESNKKAIVDAGLDYILGVKFKDIPYPIQQWRNNNPGVGYSDWADMDSPQSRWSGTAWNSDCGNPLSVFLG